MKCGGGGVPFEGSEERAKVKPMMATVTPAARVRTVRLGRRNVAAKRNRQYGASSSNATSALARYWWVSSVGSTLTVRDSPPRRTKASATHPAPAIRYRIHCSAVSTARRTNSTSETLDRTCVQCVTE